MYLHNVILETFTCYITCSTIVEKTTVTCSTPEINVSLSRFAVKIGGGFIPTLYCFELAVKSKTLIKQFYNTFQ